MHENSCHNERKLFVEKNVNVTSHRTACQNLETQESCKGMCLFLVFDGKKCWKNKSIAAQ